MGSADEHRRILVGDDAVQFNRAFARAGLDQQLLRLSTLMEENMLLASGPEGARGLFASAGFFDSLATADSLDFIGRFSARYGPEAPVLNSLGESCYEGVRLLAQPRARGLLHLAVAATALIVFLGVMLAFNFKSATVIELGGTTGDFVASAGMSMSSWKP